MPPEAPVTVEQVDREAAARFASPWVGPLERDRQRVVRGYCDDLEIVQAFAAHRLAERERCAKVVRDHPLPEICEGPYACGFMDACNWTATTIRKGDPA